MTPKGRAFIIARLSACPTKAKLREMWRDNLGEDAKRDPDVIEFAKKFAEGLPE
jgi:hypothetical protein